jgi:Tol biopolymer transport system component/DNA-binding winged helix-turn-helix (wHTH) protein
VVTPAERYAFGDVTVDVRRVEVRRAGRVVALEPKVFDVLKLLLDHRERLVTKEELVAEVWKDTFVTVNVLTRAIAQLRKALGDDAFEARYIQTVARRGYRFIAPVATTHAPDAGSASASGPVASPDTGPDPTAVPARRPNRRAALVVALLGVAAVAGVGAWLLERGRTATADPALLTPRRITSARDSYTLPCISADGSTIAYSSRRSGSEEIYLVGLAPGSRELAVTNDGGGNVHPSFSPDGRWLAYRSNARGGIWVVSATGGTPRQVADFGSQPAWAPDSRTIVFSSLGGLSSQALLWTVRLDGAPPAQLTTLGNPPGGHVEPAWSHGGGWIAFRVSRHEEREIWIVNATGGVPRRLATMTKSTPPAFSPGDSALYWIGTTAERNDCLMRLRLSAEGAAIGQPEMILPFQGADLGRLTIAQNGTALVNWNRLSVNLFALDLDGSGEAVGVPRQLTFDDETINRYPTYGHDGRVLYEQQAPGGPITAWVIDDDGGSREPLSAGRSESIRTPQWAADGRVFAVVEPGVKQRPYFAWIDTGTWQLTRIALESAGLASQPQLSPDGRQLAYHLVDPAGTVNVWVQPLGGGVPKQLTDDKEAVSYPRWSRDGRWIAVNVKRGEDTQVGVVPAEGGPVELLTAGRGTRWPSSFSPDGERVAFAGGAQGGDGWNVYTVSRRTRAVKQLTRFERAGARFPSWSPRGDRIVFARAEVRGSLWVIGLPRE